MRVLALLATYNEERFVAGCLEHLIQQGLTVHLIDNESTDATVEIAQRYVDRGLSGIETFPRPGMYSWNPILARKAELAATLDADWFLHVDADEIRLPPRTGATLVDSLAEADRAGCNAVNFLEFTFVPTLEMPDHEHERYAQTMRSYYPFLPRFPHRLNAWKRQDDLVDLVSGGGHQVSFPGLRMFPQSFPMRHYLFLSIPHAIRKYVDKEYDPKEVAGGGHRVRASLTPDSIVLLPEAELRTEADGPLDPTQPRQTHPVFQVPSSAAAE